MSAPSFYANAPELQRSEDALAAYQTFLLARNGSQFEVRDQHLADQIEGQQLHSGMRVDIDRFNRNYLSLRETDISKEELALLAFVKMNAGEAYGVEVVSRARAKRPESPALSAVLERTLQKEEEYHTRMLVGVTKYFDGLSIHGTWKPVLPLRLLIGALVRLPPTLFHPMLLASEVAGVHMFAWTLNRLRTLFPNEPDVRESMERRLIEVLVDEVGHIAYNRILTGDLGRKVARPLAKLISKSNTSINKELIALGYASELGQFDKFDLKDLPDEVRRRSFFV